jgi:hypothetical protein
VNADINAGQVGKSIGRIAHPSARHHYFNRSRDTIAHGTLAALVGREARACIIDANKKPGVE